MNGPVITPYEGKFSSILLFGPPGAGKGMLGTFLASAGSQVYLSSGAIFRKLATYSPAGKLYHQYASQGLLIPDEATIEIWKYYVQGLIATNCFYPESQDLLLDGIPRTFNQVQMLEAYIDVRHIIVLEIENREELLRRMEKRERLEGRIDAFDPEVLTRRYEVYEEETKGVLDHYPPHSISKVNGDQHPLGVLRDVLVRLSHLLSRKGCSRE